MQHKKYVLLSLIAILLLACSNQHRKYFEDPANKRGAIAAQELPVALVKRIADKTLLHQPKTEDVVIIQHAAAFTFENSVSIINIKKGEVTLYDHSNGQWKVIKPENEVHGISVLRNNGISAKLIQSLKGGENINVERVGNNLASACSCIPEKKESTNCKSGGEDAISCSVGRDNFTDFEDEIDIRSGCIASCAPGFYARCPD